MLPASKNSAAELHQVDDEEDVALEDRVVHQLADARPRHDDLYEKRAR